MIDHSSAQVTAFAVAGIGEISADTDLGELIARHTDLQPGDFVVITSKVVAKSEGRVVRGSDKALHIDAETQGLVATRGETRIVRTSQGLVLAAAGVDNSNVESGALVLLPQDPDSSAALIRRRIQTLTGINVAVIVSDTAGRAWRNGQTDIAIGAAGMDVTFNYAGSSDSYGNDLMVTEPAVADELASVAELVMGKTTGHPVAIIRGMAHLVTEDDGPGAAALVRSADDDLFPLGTFEVLRTRRTVRSFSNQPVASKIVAAAVADATTAPAPHHTRPWRFIAVEQPQRRRSLLDAMAKQWRADLEGDGLNDDEINRRLSRGEILRQAPLIVVPCVVVESAHRYSDARRSQAEHSMFVAAMGAAIQNFMVSLSVRGLGSAWIGSTLFCEDVVRQELELPHDWYPIGTVAIGHASNTPPPRAPQNISEYLLFR